MGKKLKTVPIEERENLKKRQHPRVKFTPLNLEQKKLFEELNSEDYDLFLIEGEAGTGKSILSLSFCLNSILNGVYDRLLIFKSHIELGKSIGYLPGTLSEKIEPVFESVFDNIRLIMNINDFNLLREKGKIEMAPISYIRGRSLNNSIIIIDEAQNNSLHELITIASRVGINSKMLMLYDLNQSDIGEKSGISHFKNKIFEANLSYIKYFKLYESHRSRLVKELNKIFKK